MFPDINFLIQSGWGFPSEYEGYAWLTSASNLTFGTNPSYQISDFLDMYPKFGTYAQAVAQVTVADGGAGYAVNDPLTLVQPDASGCILTVAAVDANGAVTDVTVTQGGEGYNVSSSTSVTGGAGSGALFNVTQLEPPNTVVPLVALQLYVTLASASLQQARWLEYWWMAMGLFVAHFATLYLMADGNPSSDLGRIAASGLERGLTASKSAGDVSVSRQMLNDLEGFAAWRETTYGTQLATFAMVIGAGSMLVY